MCGNHRHDSSAAGMILPRHLGIGPIGKPVRSGLHRRAFLGHFGRGIAAIALLGPVAAACGSGSTAAGDVDSADGSVVEPSGNPDLETAEPEVTGAPAGEWGRTDLGSVSAYVIARGNEAAVIDTGTAGSAAAIGQTVADLGLTYSDVKHVILTHFHPDHAGSISDVLTSAVNAVGYVGEADAGQVTGVNLTSVTGGEDIFGLQVIPTPGHTDGHICLLDGITEVLVAGDAMNGADGGVAGANPRYTPDMDQAAESIRMLAQLSFDTVYFGHGEPVIGGASSAVADLAAQL